EGCEKSVGDGVGLRWLDLSTLQRPVCIISTGRFPGNDTCFWREELRCQGCAAEEASPADRSHDNVEVCDIIKEFLGGRGLACHDIVVIERMDLRRAGLFDDAAQCLLACIKCGFTFENFPSVAMYPGLLDFRRCSWHNDVGGNVQHLRGARQCLGVVATGMRSYSASARRARKSQDSIGFASCLKRTNLL